MVAVALRSCWLGGVMDVRFPATVLAEEPDRDNGPAATGIYSVLGPFHVESVARALLAVVIERVTATTPVPEPIDLRFILVQPWNRARMAQAVQLRRAGIVPGPVRVHRVVVPDLPDHYVVMDGSHRVYAARQGGDGTMGAIVEATLRIAPEQFSLVKDTLMRCTPRGTFAVSPDAPAGAAVSRAEASLPRDVRHVLAALGCSVYPGTQFDLRPECQCAGRVRIEAG